MLSVLTQMWCGNRLWDTDLHVHSCGADHHHRGLPVSRLLRTLQVPECSQLQGGVASWSHPYRIFIITLQHVWLFVCVCVCQIDTKESNIDAVENGRPPRPLSPPTIKPQVSWDLAASCHSENIHVYTRTVTKELSGLSGPTAADVYCSGAPGPKHWGARWWQWWGGPDLIPGWRDDEWREQHKWGGFSVRGGQSHR